MDIVGPLIVVISVAVAITSSLMMWWRWSVKERLEREEYQRERDRRYESSLHEAREEASEFANRIVAELEDERQRINRQRIATEVFREVHTSARSANGTVTINENGERSYSYLAQPVVPLDHINLDFVIGSDQVEFIGSESEPELEEPESKRTFPLNDYTQRKLTP